MDNGKTEGLAAEALARFAPDWPGLKLGVEHGEIQSDGSMRLWQSAACVEPDGLRAFAAKALAAMGGHPGFPWSREDLEAGSQVKVGEQSERGPVALGEAQALAAIMWALDPLYGEFDAELARSESALESRKAGIAMAPIHVVQLPWGPVDLEDGEPCMGEGPGGGGDGHREEPGEAACADEAPAGEAKAAERRRRTKGKTTGNWFRVSYSFMREAAATEAAAAVEVEADAASRGDENEGEALGAPSHRNAVKSAAALSVSALLRLGEVDSSACAEDERVEKNSAGRLSSAWEFHALGGFRRLWEKVEVAMSSARPSGEARQKGARL